LQVKTTYYVKTELSQQELSVDVTVSVHVASQEITANNLFYVMSVQMEKLVKMEVPQQELTH